MWPNGKTTNVFLASEPGSDGGVAPPAAAKTDSAAAASGTAATTEAAAATVEIALAGMTKAQRAAAYDQYGCTDAMRAQGERLAVKLDKMNPVERLEATALWEAEVARRAAAAADGADGKKKSAPAAEDVDDDPVLTRLKAAEAKLERLEGAKANEDRAALEAKNKAAWQAEVKETLADAPAFAKLADDPKRLRSLSAQALGYVAEYIAEHGGSKKAALKAFIDERTELAAEAANQTVAEFVKRKTADRKATGERGGGRPPAETIVPSTAAELRSGAAKQKAAALLGIADE
ncbi:MAG: hypothetical protein PHU85_00315 [Phycisphaerae bacterium]|nr:hypothetical protein [Phycisphaerae bacterium]